MSDVLNGSLFLVKERTGLLRIAHECDILDPQTGRAVMECREDDLRGLRRACRYVALLRGTTGFDLRIREPDGAPVARMTRGVPVTASRVKVYDGTDALIGGFQQPVYSVAGGFDVLAATGEVVCQFRGKLAGWRSFHFQTPDGIELARVTKKWAGLGRELITGADDYMLEIDSAVPPDSATRRLILASAICVGLLFKIEIP